MERIVHNAEKCWLADRRIEGSFLTHSSHAQSIVDSIIGGFSMCGMIQKFNRKELLEQSAHHGLVREGTTKRNKQSKEKKLLSKLHPLSFMNCHCCLKAKRIIDQARRTS